MREITRDQLVIWSVVVVILIFFAALVFVSLKDDEDWGNYSRIHHCVKIGGKHSQMSPGFSSDGRSVVNVTPAQTIYRCDAGEIQIR